MTVTIKHDRNGNKILSVPGNQYDKGFSIQTLGNLPLCHGLPTGKHELTGEQAAEVENWIACYGTYRQKYALARALASNGGN